MIEFGKTLREAREARGYTIAQVAEMTRIMSSIVADLENENFQRIAAPIYGRGFVKLYCEAVGLDPKPLVAEFMEIFSGNRDLRIRERPSEAAPVTVVADISEKVEQVPVVEQPADVQPSVPEPPPAAVKPLTVEPPPVVATPIPLSEPDREEPIREPVQLNLYDNFESASATQGVPPPVADALPAEPARESVFARYASPLHEHAKTAIRALDARPAAWRIALLALVALALLYASFMALRALYRATNAEPVEREEALSASVVQPTARPAVQPATRTAAAPRTPQAVPPLYVD